MMCRHLDVIYVQANNISMHFQLLQTNGFRQTIWSTVQNVQPVLPLFFSNYQIWGGIKKTIIFLYSKW